MAAAGRDLVVPAERAQAFIVGALVALGLPEPDAHTCAQRIAEADLRGVDTHGIFRLPHSARRIQAGGINRHPRVCPVHEAPVDGDNGMGHVVMTAATELAIRKAAQSGLAWVGVCNGNHAGPAAVYSTMPLAHDTIGTSMTVANANHMATTVSSDGKIVLTAQKGEAAPRATGSTW